MTPPPGEFARWPTLLGGLMLAGAGIGLDLATHEALAYGLMGLAAACFGAFLYAEGARHREWWNGNPPEDRGPPDVPSRDDHDV